MSPVDIVLILCFLPSIKTGLTRGFVSQAAAIISLILGVWLSFRFSTAVSAWLGTYIEVSPQVLQVIAFVLIIILVILLLQLIAKIVSGILDLVLLGWADRLLGFVFALLKGALVIGVVIMLFNTINNLYTFVPEEVLGASVLYPPLKMFAYTVFPYFKELLF